MLSWEFAVVYELGSDSSFSHILLMMMFFFVFFWYCLWLIWYFGILSIIGLIFSFTVYSWFDILMFFRFGFIIFSSKMFSVWIYSFLFEGHFSWKCKTEAGRGPDLMRQLRLKNYSDCIENGQKTWLQHVVFVL